MTIVTICSTRSSPGATSLCVALGAAWARRGPRPLLIEADPAGGVIGLRFAMSAEPSLRTLWADMRRGYSPELIQQNSTDLRGIDCLLAPTDPLLAARALEHVAPVLSRELATLRRPVIIDLGRISDTNQAIPFVGCATHVLLVGRPRVEDTQSLLYGSRLLGANAVRPSIVSIGDGPHHPTEMAALADLPLAAVLPDDRAVASAFSGGRCNQRTLLRSTLWRCVDSLAEQLTAESVDLVPTPTEPVDAGRAAPTPTPAPLPHRDVTRHQPGPPPAPNVAPPCVAHRQMHVDHDFWTDRGIDHDPDITVPRREPATSSNAGAR